VRTYGWFENTESVFITMEYFPLGDLQKFMRTSPPFSEEATRQIVRQLLGGVDFMHESGFAHRDIKLGVCYLVSEPYDCSGLKKLQNILVESNSLNGSSKSPTSLLANERRRERQIFELTLEYLAILRQK